MILQPYGMTIAIAILIGAYVASRLARESGEVRQAGQVWDALPWVLVFGLVGARLYHVFSLWEFYQANPVAILFIWNGGLAIYGAILGGAVGLGIYLRRESGESGGIGGILDIAAPGVAIGQAVGRFANFFSQELYGWPTRMPWGIYIRPENRFPGLEDFSFFHPLFLYEALWNLLNFVVLVKVSRAKLLTGERFLLYLSIYALGRFFLESMRIESWMIGGVRVAQAVSVVVIFGSIGLAVFRRLGKGQLKISNLKHQITNNIK